MNYLRDNDEESAVIAVIDREVAAAARGNFEQYNAILADDVQFIPPNSRPRSGTRLREWLGEFLEGFAVEWVSFRHVEVVVDGHHAYHSYEYEWRVTPRSGGEVITSRGKGLHVLRGKQRDPGRLFVRSGTDRRQRTEKGLCQDRPTVEMRSVRH
jgi:ketosteroid isomerase-like protein